MIQKQCFLYHIWIECLSLRRGRPPSKEASPLRFGGPERAGAGSVRPDHTCFRKSNKLKFLLRMLVSVLFFDEFQFRFISSLISNAREWKKLWQARLNPILLLKRMKLRIINIEAAIRQVIFSLSCIISFHFFYFIYLFIYSLLFCLFYSHIEPTVHFDAVFSKISWFHSKTVKTV